MEHEWLSRLSQRKTSSNILETGIGDDAAVFAANRGRQVVTVDILTEGVDFLLSETPPELIGRKSLAVNLSDLAAMAATPTAFLFGLVLPNHTSQKNPVAGVELAERLLAGMTPLMEKYGMVLAGGDTNTWDGGCVISITAVGLATDRGPLLRSGAKPGDHILVTGAFGGSILRRQFTFEPRIHEALFLNEHYEIHAAMDVSDGLSLDLFRMATASGVSAVYEESKIPIHPDVYEWMRLSHSVTPSLAMTPIDHALADGEDFELILAVPPDEARRLIQSQPLGVPLTDIGIFQKTETSESELFARTVSGEIRRVAPRGFLHR